jgi:Fe2+ or Zn2+ uptake regulation protein
MPIKPENIKNSIITALKEKGFKLTPQRLQIIDIMAHDRSHPSAMTLYKKARKKIPSISISTVYLTLALLKKYGLIKELEFNEMDNRYDGNTTKHVNLICAACGIIEDFEAELPVSTNIVQKRTGFRAYDTRMEYYGYCRKCNVKNR